MLTIGFSRPRHWTLLSALIRAFTRSRVSHAWIGATAMFSEGTPIKIVLHATQGGVKIDLRDRFEAENTVIAEFDVSELRPGLPHAVSHIGDRYDYPALIGFAWLILMWRWFKKKVRNPLASPTALVCSELTLHLAHGIDFPPFRGLDLEATTAQDLLAALLAGGRAPERSEA